MYDWRDGKTYRWSHEGRLINKQTLEVYDFTFEPPPVCTAYWDADDWASFSTLIKVSGKGKDNGNVQGQ